MSKKMMIVIALQVLLLVVGIVWYQNRTISDYQAVGRAGKQIYDEACISCHPITEFDNRNLSVEYTKKLVIEGRGVMPKYPEIQEPELSRLAEYVNQL
ncbi:c-type cytochrome [Selenihalanaerobacter shriftii]|uniref:Cytochrome C oxidase, cbb3-type, subunit III n=1 Tax=Selenihalanaerobacter shriftii TaxID=142842 RepID=A0A1T4L217_9FIRM|nr:cytochrome c [Selenihalanaerobacter shriftii]SJZ48590.1 Cytochrome C oxidase, cbb3-type, subunit III [Selenihalanaerobacter shriftii]